MVWAATACLALFIQPRYDDVANAELLYYSVYNVAIGAAVGFRLFDRAAKDGFALFALRGCSAILFGTLVNEAFVEPLAFGTARINGEGLYYGLTDALSMAGFFVLLRLAERLHAVQRPAEADARNAPDAPLAPSRSDRSDDGWFFVRAAGETRRIYAPDVLYMEAERDFTRIVCANGEHFVSENLKNLLRKSAAFGLIRIHKSYAVNLSRVDRLARAEVQLGDCRVPVGRRYRPAFAETWRARSAPAAAR